MKILVSAFACSPGRGSEPGVGWHWPVALSEEHEVWVLTRSRYREPIEAELAVHPNPRLHFVYFDIPPITKLVGGSQEALHLYYYLWQLGSVKVARSAHARVDFDLSIHVTWATGVVPSNLTALPIPFVWGPLGGGVTFPWRLYRSIPPSDLRHEVFRAARRAASRYFDPFLRLTWRRADVILLQNEESRRLIPRRYQPKTRLIGNGGYDVGNVQARRPSGQFEVIAVGRLIAFKAYHLALRAIALSGIDDLHLTIVGDGPERESLLAEAMRLGIAGRVTMTGLIPQERVYELLASADVFVHPCLHEEFSLALVEAMAAGVVPIVIDLGGPAQIAGDIGLRCKYRSESELVEDMAAHLIRLRGDRAELERRSRQAMLSASSRSWDRLHERIAHIGLEEIVSSASRVRSS